MKYAKMLIFPLFGFHIFLSDAIAQRHPCVDWSTPEAIDPLQEDIGNFLDEDLSVYCDRANAAYRNGQFKEAARYFLFLLRHKYDDYTTIYNLACCYGRLGEAELAARYLDRAVNAGFRNFKLVKQDRDFDKIWGDKRFYKVLRRLETLSENLGKIIYVKSCRLSECRIQFPDNYDPDKKYPLVIGLHGYGSNPENMMTLWQYFGHPNFLFAAPRGAYRVRSSIDEKFELFSWELRVDDKDLWKRGDPLTLDYIVEVAKTIADQYLVGDIYLLGFSQGAGYAYATGIKNPDLFKGLVCLSGILPFDDDEVSLLSKDDIQSANHLRIFIAHGTRDHYERGTRSRDILKENGYGVTFYDFEGGHFIHPEIIKKITKWINQ